MVHEIDPAARIGHVHLKVADLVRAVAFYGGVLGFEVRHRSPGAGSCRRADAITTSR